MRALIVPWTVFGRCAAKLSHIHPLQKLLPCLQVHRHLVYVPSKPVYPVFLQAEDHFGRTAIVDQHGSHTYDSLLGRAVTLAQKLLQTLHVDNLNKQRVAFLCPNDSSYTLAQWATWLAGGIAVPLSMKVKTKPSKQMQYYIQDSDSTLLVTTEDYDYDNTVELLSTQLGIRNLILNQEDILSQEKSAQGLDLYHAQIKDECRKKAATSGGFRDEPAMLIYTSGTTGPPKGVVLSFGNLEANVRGMIDMWEWRSSDTILHVLPLHHIHGVVNTLMTPLYVGATCVMMPAFKPNEVWEQLVNPVNIKDPHPVNVFMAVPTIYKLLIDDYDQRLAGSGTRELIKSACTNRIRLMVSGSAALPTPVMERWYDITGHMLLERYGMSETGMALTNPLHGTRIPGAVGRPFPGVEVCVTKANAYTDTGYDVITEGNHVSSHTKSGMEGESGELYVRGPNVFMEYWNKPEATKAAFTKDGWFKTGDTAVYQNGVYRILGRTSVDIIKSGGYKISALDVERHLLSHPDIQDCAVVGITDLTWGQRVAAVVVLKHGVADLTLQALREWAGDVMAPYQVPSVMKVIAELPRNAMGKINKKDLVKTVFDNSSVNSSTNGNHKNSS